MAIAAARVGARAGYVTRVGDDAFGRMFVALWKREGVATDGVAVDADAPTGVYFVTHGPQGHEFGYLRAGSAAAGWRRPTCRAKSSAAAKILHVSGISQAISASACDASLAAMDEARAAGVRVSYDTNLRLKLWPLPRARAVILASLARCDYCVPSLDDAQLLFDTADQARSSTPAIARARPIVVLKCGARGCMVSGGGASRGDRRPCRSPASMPPAQATASTAHSRRASSRATIRSARRTTRMPRRRSRQPATAPSLPLPRDADVRAQLARATR